MKQEKIEQIIIVGHYNCKILNHILGFNKDFDCIQLQNDVGLLANYSSDRWHQFVEFHTALQVRDLSQLPSIKEMKEKHELKIKGIIVNENNGNEVIELDIPKALKANTILN